MIAHRAAAALAPAALAARPGGARADAAGRARRPAGAGSTISCSGRPVSEDERLSFLLRSALTNFPPPQAIRSLSLRLSSLTGETGKQLSLGQEARQQRQLEEAIRQLKARYGYSPVYRCVDVEPWSVIPEERQILVESDA